MMKVDGGQQCNNHPTKRLAKAGSGDGGNSDSNGSGEDGDGDGNATAPVMDSDGRCDGDGDSAGNGWHNGYVAATRRRLTARQHLQYMEQCLLDFSTRQCPNQRTNNITRHVSKGAFVSKT